MTRRREEARPPLPKGEGDSQSPRPLVSESPPLPWGQLLLVFTAPLAVMIALLNFAPLLPIVKEEFGLTNTMAGLLASATLLSHTLLQLPGGQITDRIGAKRATGLGLILAGVSVVASGLAPDFSLLLFSRFCSGAGTALTFIAGLACVNALVPLKRRVVAQGLYGAAANAGVVLVLLLSERIAVWGGWRGTFVAEGVVILCIACWLLSGVRLEAVPNQAVYPSWAELLRQSHLYLLGLAHIITYGSFMALSTWIATFLWQRHGVGLEWAGPLAALLPASSMLARSLGGALSVGRERWSILLSCSAAALCAAAIPILPGTLPTLLAVMLLGWFIAMPFGAIFSYVSLISEKEVPARSLSLINFVANLGALTFPPLIGYVLDVAGSYSMGFGVLAGIGLIGSAVLAIWLPRPRR